MKEKNKKYSLIFPIFFDYEPLFYEHSWTWRGR